MAHGRIRVYEELIPTSVAMPKEQYFFLRSQSKKNNMFVSEYVRYLIKNDMDRVGVDCDVKIQRDLCINK